MMGVNCDCGHPNCSDPELHKRAEGAWACPSCNAPNYFSAGCCHKCNARISRDDHVNHPPHYTTGSVECIDAIKEVLGDGFKDFLRGNVMKYLWRAEHKGNTKQDYEKAQWYLARLIGECE